MEIIQHMTVTSTLQEMDWAIGCFTQIWSASDLNAYILTESRVEQNEVEVGQWSTVRLLEMLMGSAQFVRGNPSVHPFSGKLQ